MASDLPPIYECALAALLIDGVDADDADAHASTGGASGPAAATPQRSSRHKALRSARRSARANSRAHGSHDGGRIGIGGASASATLDRACEATAIGAPPDEDPRSGIRHPRALSQLLENDSRLFPRTPRTNYTHHLSHLTRSHIRSSSSGNPATTTSAAAPITRRAHARVGLVGNPSDGFFGKTISVSVENFWAEVAIHESDTVRLVPNVLSDPNDFGSLADLHGISRKEGYQGGLVLLQATCKKFHEYCSKRGIALAKRNFTLRYNTNIPRQVGLAGSSAIVTAAFQCLMAFYQLGERDIPKALQPDFVLSVEMEELFIQAGRYREI